MPNGTIDVKDVDQLRQFATALRTFNSEISSSKNRIKSKLIGLSHVWRDQQYRIFAQEFEQAMQNFERYLQNSDSYIRYLNAKIKPLEEYLGRG